MPKYPEERTEGDDWNEVVKWEPKGYCEIQDLEKNLVYHGPIQKVDVDSGDNVLIELKWVAQMELEGEGFGKWIRSSDKNLRFSFPNFMVPYVLERTAEKGFRVRFGLDFIYLEPDPESDARILAAIS